MAAVVVLLLAVTGVMLNHVDDLAWMKGNVTSSWLLDWYGVAPSEEIVHFEVGRHSAAGLEGGLYLDGRLVDSSPDPLVGAVPVQRYVAFAMPDRIVIYDPVGGGGDAPPPVVDQMDSASLPGVVVRVGATADRRIALQSASQRFVSTPDLLGWEPLDAGAEVSWSAPSEASEAQRDAILRGYRGNGLPRTRVVADLHAGRLFGRFGPLAMDLSAVALLVLVVTGLAGSGFGRRRSSD